MVPIKKYQFLIVNCQLIVIFAKNIRIMSVVRLQATIQDSDVPYLERFLKGISATDIKFEDEENYFDILSTEDLEMIAISKEQGNLGMVTKNEDVFKEIRELRERKWK